MYLPVKQSDLWCLAGSQHSHIGLEQRSIHASSWPLMATSDRTGRKCKGKANARSNMNEIYTVVASYQLKAWFGHLVLQSSEHSLKITMKYSICILITTCFPEVAGNLDISAYKKQKYLIIYLCLRSAGTTGGILAEYQMSTLQSESCSVLSCFSQLGN